MMGWWIGFLCGAMLMLAVFLALVWAFGLFMGRLFAAEQEKARARDEARENLQTAMERDKRAGINWHDIPGAVH